MIVISQAKLGHFILEAIVGPGIGKEPPFVRLSVSSSLTHFYYSVDFAPSCMVSGFNVAVAVKMREESNINCVPVFLLRKCSLDVVTK